MFIFRRSRIEAESKSLYVAPMATARYADFGAISRCLRAGIKPKFEVTPLVIHMSMGNQSSD